MGSTVWGVLHSSVFLYEADDAPEAMTAIKRHLVSISPFQQPRKKMHATHVWKTISTITLWILWKYCCKRRYDSIIPLPSDILLELWESLLAVVRGQYDNMSGSSEVVLKKRKKLLQEVASVYDLLSRTGLEISSPLACPDNLFCI